MNKFLAVSVVVFLAAGCTTAGPYVTNISSDGNYGMNVEKCMVELNAFMGTVATTNCTSQNIKLTREVGQGKREL